jgi:hypothetical protein
METIIRVSNKKPARTVRPPSQHWWKGLSREAQIGQIVRLDGLDPQALRNATPVRIRGSK